MTDLRQAAMQALKALEWSWGGEPLGTMELDAITALRKALEQPEQEPVASIYISQSGEREFDDWKCKLPIGRNLLYTTPPAAQRKPLTATIIVNMMPSQIPSEYDGPLMEFARAIEAAHNIKEGT